MRNILIISFAFLVLISCSKDRIYPVSNPVPKPVQNDSIDIDGDATYDFLIEYTTVATTDVPSSNQSTIGKIRPLGKNRVLYKRSDGFLFLKVNDTISREPGHDFIWSKYAASLISLDHNNSDKKWEVLSNLSSDYFLGFQLKSEGSESIGWMLLNFDTEDGKIAVAEKEITSSETLIIRK